MRVLVVSLALAASSRAADRAVAFIRLAKRRRPDVGIVALGPALDAALLRAAVDAGADACCLATAPPARLAQAIKAVASGAMWLDPGIAGILLHPHPHVNGVHLSLRERAVLALIADGLSNAEIAAKLGCATATVHTHVIRLFRKLGVRDRVRAAVCALRDGLV
jgi:DNA-binding NarL/FixJ family response regulator